MSSTASHCWQHAGRTPAGIDLPTCSGCGQMVGEDVKALQCDCCHTSEALVWFVGSVVKSLIVNRSPWAFRVEFQGKVNTFVKAPYVDEWPSNQNPGAVMKEEKIAKVDMTWERGEFLDACGKGQEWELNIQIDHQQRAGASRSEECSIEMALQKKKNAFQFRV